MSRADGLGLKTSRHFGSKVLRQILAKLTHLTSCTQHWEVISVSLCHEVFYESTRRASKCQAGSPASFPHCRSRGRRLSQHPASHTSSAQACESFRRWRRRSDGQSAHGNKLAKCQGMRKPTRRLHVRASGLWLITSVVETLEVVESQQSARSSRWGQCWSDVGFSVATNLDRTRGNLGHLC